MKKICTIPKILLTLLFLFSIPSFAGSTLDSNIAYNKVYRTDRIADSYHFLLLEKSGKYYHLHTNKTSTITPKELKSSKILKNLDKKQSWGQAFASKGDFIREKGKIYTKRYWDRIKSLSTKKIKYLNKTYTLQ
jgi:hypothetical protein